MFKTVHVYCPCCIILHVSHSVFFSWGPDDNGKTVDGPHQLAQVCNSQLNYEKLDNKQHSVTLIWDCYVFVSGFVWGMSEVKY